LTITHSLAWGSVQASWATLGSPELSVEKPCLGGTEEFGDQLDASVDLTVADDQRWRYSQHATSGFRSQGLGRNFRDLMTAMPAARITRAVLTTRAVRTITLRDNVIVRTDDELLPRTRRGLTYRTDR
jgi:hypothetical protein